MLSRHPSTVFIFCQQATMPETAHARFNAWLEQSDPEEDTDVDDDDGPQSREADRQRHLAGYIRRHEAGKPIFQEGR